LVACPHCTVSVPRERQLKSVVHAALVLLVVAGLLFGAVGSVRWAKRGGATARLMASALVLTLGMGVVVQPPQQGVEQAEEEAEKEKSESGEPLV
jgi:uncharacterized membrane protein